MTLPDKHTSRPAFRLSNPSKVIDDRNAILVSHIRFIGKKQHTFNENSPILYKSSLKNARLGS